MRLLLSKMLATFLLMLICCADGKRINTVAGNFVAEDETLPRCSVISDNIRQRESLAYAAYPPDTRGSWVSQDCENRPGPEFLLRHYHFERDQRFKLLQHFYADEWCTTPLYTLVARGQIHLREPSWLVPGGTDADYVLYGVSVIAYSNEILEDITNRVNKSCPGYVSRPWRSHREYLIYSYAEDGNDMELTKRQSNASGKKSNYARSKRVSHNGSHYQSKYHDDHDEVVSNETVEEMDCLSAFNVVFHELQLIRSVRKPRQTSLNPQVLPLLLPKRPGKYLKNKSKHGEDNKYQSFLYLGDVHPDIEYRTTYKPTAYQRPLVKAHEVPDCHICRSVSKSTEKSPPHLHARPKLPVYPAGDWTSSQCEVRSIGMFVTRQIRILDSASDFAEYQSQPTFQAVFNYFLDPTCETSTFSVLASGSYFIARDSETTKSGTGFDFVINRVVITPHDEATAHNLNGLRGNVCGIDGSWRVNVPQDVSSTGGCLGLGIRVPSTARDILKMDLDPQGNPLLYFGSLEGVSDQDETRPTHYLPPLVHCRGNDDFSVTDLSNELIPTFYARTSAASKNAGILFQTVLVSVSVLFASAIYYQNY